MTKNRVFQAIGAVGVLAGIIIYIKEPSFPTPDKLLVFGTFLAMVFSLALELLKRFLPVVALLLSYESFRGLVPQLNSHVNFGFMPAADKLLFFGQLPTKWLQNQLWHGYVQWYDFVFYLAYMLHFVLPLVLIAFVWRLRDSQFWQVATTYIVVSYMGFLTYVLFPAAPPWMASDMHLIEPIVRISSNVWFALGVHDFPSLYNQIAPNPVAAVPSLHAAYAVLLPMFATKLFKNKWLKLTWIYPALILVGTVYQGEHYLIDIIIGAAYALIGYWISPYILSWLQKSFRELKHSVVR